MIATPNRLSLGALALTLCLALPAGLLSLLSPTTTADQIDAADRILVGRVASLQHMSNPQSTALEFAVDRMVWGRVPAGGRLNVTVAGRVQAEVGDTVLALMSARPTALLGLYQLDKNPRTLEYEVVTPITGLMAQGLSSGGLSDPVPLPLMQAAILARRGVNMQSLPIGGGGQIQAVTGLPDDPYEPNNTLATATQLTGLFPPSLLTGNPLILGDLSLTRNDVDFFVFEAGALSILHAETKAITGLPAPDTLIGLFDAGTAQLLASDDDGGEGQMSKLIVPLEKTGLYAVAVQSAPDAALDFLGDDGTTTGHYSLSLELEFGSYLWNQFDLIMGVSPDGTWIEDFVGFKEIGGQDVLLAGVPADGWAVEFDVHLGPQGITHVYGGSGGQLSDPGFTHSWAPISFALANYEDVAGTNRRGYAEASSIVSYTPASGAPRGVITTVEYKIPVGSNTVYGDIALELPAPSRLSNLAWTRVTDIDLFGNGSDQFFWSFHPGGKLKAFAVDTNTHVGNVVIPAQSFGNATGNLQAALVIEHGSSSGTGGPDKTHYATAYTWVKGFATANAALNEAVRRLRLAGVETWVVAVDADPDSGLFAAFGTGLGKL